MDYARSSIEIATEDTEKFKNKKTTRIHSVIHTRVTEIITFWWPVIRQPTYSTQSFDL